jgi:hypothetical protein
MHVAQVRCLARDGGGSALDRSARAIEARRHEPGRQTPVPLPLAVDVGELRGEVVRVGAHTDRRLQLPVAQQVTERDGESRAHRAAEAVARARADERL